MRIMLILLLITVLINLTACSSMAGNVIPNKGPSMEQIYDGMGRSNSREQDARNKNNTADLTSIRQEHYSGNKSRKNSLAGNVNSNAIEQEFHQLPNPELRLYVFPHLVGADQIPVPGYFTAFNVYEHNYYALPQEMVRGEY